MQVYIATQGARVVKESRRLKVRIHGDTAKTLFTDRIDQLVLLGNIELSHRAVVELLKREIDTVFLSSTGRYFGRFASVESKNVFLRSKQFALLHNTLFQVGVARSIVAGKLANQATLLKRIERTKGVKELRQVAQQIRDLALSAQSAETIDVIRGYEGKAGALFFSGFRYGFLDDQGFRKRVRRPPTDPVNSVLSLLYTLLMNRVYAAVRMAQLDPYPGSLHALDYGRYSLVLDLMEEFRVIIADTLCISLFNLKVLQADDFCFQEEDIGEDESDSSPTLRVTSDPIGLISPTVTRDADTFDVPEQRMGAGASDIESGEGKRPVVLKPDALKKVLEGFERKLTTRFYHAPSDKEISYSDALYVQAMQYRKLVEGDLSSYQPILLK